MTDADELQQQRFENLEIKLSELENALAELNDVVLTQYRDIDALRRDNRQLAQRLDNALESADAPSAEDERPPHY